MIALPGRISRSSSLRSSRSACRWVPPDGPRRQAVGLLLFFPSFLLGVGGPPPAAMGEVLRTISEWMPLGIVTRAVREPWLGIGPATGTLLITVALAVAAAALRRAAQPCDDGNHDRHRACRRLRTQRAGGGAVRGGGGDAVRGGGCARVAAPGPVVGWAGAVAAIAVAATLLLAGVSGVVLHGGLLLIAAALTLVQSAGVCPRRWAGWGSA